MDKKDKRFKNLFGLDPNSINQFKRICGTNQTKLNRAMFLFNNRQAVGTAINYRNVIKDFEEHCDKNPLFSFEKFTEREVGDFILSKELSSMKPGYIQKIKPAISRLETIRGVRPEDSAFTPTIDAMLVGAKRLAGELAPTVKKMEPLPKELLITVLEHEVWIHVEQPERINLKKFRTIFKWMIMAYTLCRGDEFYHLQAKHFRLTDDGNDIAITFPRSKTDQYHNSFVKYIPKENGEVLNPVEITALYFKRCGFKMDCKDESFIDCRIAWSKSGYRARGDCRLGKSSGNQASKQLMEEYGYDSSKYGENSSAKRLGVSEAVHKGVPIDVVQQCGGWKTSYMPLMYLKNSEQHKVKIARAMKFSEDSK